MKVTWWQGMTVAVVAVALLAGCTGGSAEAPRSAPDSSAPRSTPPAEPTQGGVTPPASPGPTQPPEPPKPLVRKPVIGRVWTTPRLQCDAACTLNPPVGSVTFHAQVSDATRVQFFLVPTGTDTWGNRKSVGVDGSGADGWSARYTYADEPLWSHLVVLARGPGGTTEKLPFTLYHPDPR